MRFEYRSNKIVLTDDDKKRFYSKIKIDTDTGCHIFTRCVSQMGYGNFKINGTTILTHRIAWTLKYGPIPKGLCVLHKCDNPICCNPQHLTLGTQTDNMKDMAKKHRSHSGIKLKDKEVLEIYEKRKHLPNWKVAEMYNVAASTISRIVHKVTYKYLLRTVK